MPPLKKPAVVPPRAAQAGSDSSTPIMVVTGSDVSGKLFREQPELLGLEGEECRYHSRHNVEKGSWLMVEIRSNGGESWRAGAQVKSVLPARSEEGRFDVRVQLERAYGKALIVSKDARREEEAELEADLALIPQAQPAEPTAEPVAETPPSPPPAPKPAPKIELAAEPQPSAPPPVQEVVDPAPPKPQGKTADAANARAAVVEMLREAIARESAKNAKEMMASMSAEVERVVDKALSTRLVGEMESRLGAKIQDVVRSQTGTSETRMQQVAARVHETLQSRATLDLLEAGLRERWNHAAQSLQSASEERLHARLRESDRRATEAAAAQKSKVDELRAEMQDLSKSVDTAVYDSSEAARQAQEALRRLDETLESAAPKIMKDMQARIDGQINEFARRLDRMVAERASQFISQVEELLAPRANDAEMFKQQLAEQMQSIAERLIDEQALTIRGMMETAKAQVQQEVRAVLRQLSNG